MDESKGSGFWVTCFAFFLAFVIWEVVGGIICNK